MTSVTKVHRVVFQDAGGLAALVANDGAAVRVGRLLIDACELQDQRVHQGHVTVETRDTNTGAFGVSSSIQLTGRQLAALQLVIPLPSRLHRPSAFPAQLARFASWNSAVRRRRRIDLRQREIAVDEMHVVVDEAGVHERAFQIDRIGLCIREFTNVRRGSDSRRCRRPSMAIASALGRWALPVHTFAL